MARAATERINLDSAGAVSNNQNYSPSINANGRYVAFSSPASNLVEDDTNGMFDIFIHDRKTNTTQRVSVNALGEAGNKNSLYPSISANGCDIAFESKASNLANGDANGRSDIFVYHCKSQQIERISNGISESQANDASTSPSLSPDGRYVAFTSKATNLIADDSNGKTDVFIYDRETGITEQASVTATGAGGDNASQHPSISEDGRFIAFESRAHNLTDNDANGKIDIFVYDRELKVVQRISTDSTGIEGNGDSEHPSISADGRYVAFSSDADNLVPADTNEVADIFLYDRETHTLQRVSVNFSGEEGNGFSASPAISADGRHVAFQSNASNLIPTDTNGIFDIFVYDHDSHETRRVSVNSNGIESNNSSETPSISADGHYVAFKSYASNLVPRDSNKKSDIFVQGPNKPPEITSSSEAVIAENTTVVQTLEANDPDGDRVLFTVTGGADQSLFTVNAVAQLSFLTAPITARPSDSDADNVYEVEITADDEQGGTALQIIHIGVVTENDLSSRSGEALIQSLKEPPDNSSGGGSLGFMSLLIGLLTPRLKRRLVNYQQAVAFR
jgi:Tol biopolymer transport system component